jgi:hypothetical protein
MKLFKDSRLKIERAKQHIDDLDGRITAFQADGLHRISIDADLQTGNDIIKIAPTKPIPNDFSLILGDALHNLKSALDITINEIVFFRLKVWDDHCRFTVSPTRDELVNRMKGGKIFKASVAVCNFLVDVVKPYKGGNDYIWALHRLNIEDKHRLLIPTLRMDISRGLSYEDERGEKVTIGTWGIAKGRTVSHETFSRNVKIIDEGQATFHVLLDVGIGMPYDGADIVTMLHDLAEVVSSIVYDIEKVFMAEQLLMDGGSHPT